MHGPCHRDLFFLLIFTQSFAPPSKIKRLKMATLALPLYTHTHTQKVNLEAAIKTFENNVHNGLDGGKKKKKGQNLGMREKFGAP